MRQSKIKECEKKRQKLEKEAIMAAEEVDYAGDTKVKKELQKEADKKLKELNDFILNVYAKAVFEAYVDKKPKIVDKEAKKVLEWDDVFGTNFKGLSNVLRSSLVGLITKDGKYKLK